ncbi:MAG: hypothetical protein B7Z14_09035 [Bosea sp. 32-68-6]|nr:MAG: hypothetical protein B7Z14_09035 [Bosea sp. 32-68-6]
MSMEWHTRIWLAGMPIAAGAELGINEDHGDPQRRTRVNDWNGYARSKGTIPSRHRKLYDISLECEDRWGPAFDDVSIGERREFHSSKHDTTYIPAGQSSVTLRRFPVPEATKPSGYAVLAYRVDNGAPIAVTVVGRTVSIVPQDVAVVIRVRPIRAVEIVEITPGRAIEKDGKQSWGMKLMEIEPPVDWTPGTPLQQLGAFA